MLRFIPTALRIILLFIYLLPVHNYITALVPVIARSLTSHSSLSFFFFLRHDDFPRMETSSDGHEVLTLATPSVNPS